MFIFKTTTTFSYFYHNIFGEENVFVIDVRACQSAALCTEGESYEIDTVVVLFTLLKSSFCWKPKQISLDPKEGEKAE